jgi:hypothetical protein
MKNPEANQNDDSKKLLCPKACILIQARRRPHSTGRPVLNGKVNNALIKLKSSGLADNTRKNVSGNLRFHTQVDSLNRGGIDKKSHVSPAEAPATLHRIILNVKSVQRSKRLVSAPISTIRDGNSCFC